MQRANVNIILVMVVLVRQGGRDHRMEMRAPKTKILDRTLVGHVIVTCRIAIVAHNSHVTFSAPFKVNIQNIAELCRSYELQLLILSQYDRSLRVKFTEGRSWPDHTYNILGQYYGVLNLVHMELLGEVCQAVQGHWNLIAFVLNLISLPPLESDSGWGLQP